jgi:hypothetical protein
LSHESATFFSGIKIFRYQQNPPKLHILIPLANPLMSYPPRAKPSKIEHKKKTEPQKVTSFAAPIILVAMNKLITLLVLSATIYSVAAFGKQLIRSAGKQQPLPVTVSAAQADGWVKSSRGCDPLIGQAYNKAEGAPTSQYPITLYFAANGMISGFGTDVFGKAPDNLVERGYWIPVAKHQYRIQAATRNVTANLCTSTAPFADTIGDRVVINPSKLNQRIPPTDLEAGKAKWTYVSGSWTATRFFLASDPVFSDLFGRFLGFFLSNRVIFPAH